MMMMMMMMMCTVRVSGRRLVAVGSVVRVFDVVRTRRNSST